MTIKKILSSALLLVVLWSCADKTEMVFVEGNELVSDFNICTHVVTQSEYKSIMKKNPSFSKKGNKPVEMVSWFDAVEYCNKLSKKQKLTPCYKVEQRLVEFDEDAVYQYDVTQDDSPKYETVVICDFQADGYRLPTEAEWEYAAKGGNKSKGYKYSGSDNVDDVAWYDDNSGYATNPIKLKLPNELGIYDMSGNIWEWCWDWYDSDNYPVLVKDYTGPENGFSRVSRGGSCRSYGTSCAVDYRDYDNPESTIEHLGFRVVRSALK